MSVDPAMMAALSALFDQKLATVIHDVGELKIASQELKTSSQQQAVMMQQQAKRMDSMESRLTSAESGAPSTSGSFASGPSSGPWASYISSSAGGGGPPSKKRAASWDPWFGKSPAQAPPSASGHGPSAASARPSAPFATSPPAGKVSIVVIKGFLREIPARSMRTYAEAAVLPPLAAAGIVPRIVTQRSGYSFNLLLEGPSEATKAQQVLRDAALAFPDKMATQGDPQAWPLRAVRHVAIEHRWKQALLSKMWDEVSRAFGASTASSSGWKLSVWADAGKLVAINPELDAVLPLFVVEPGDKSSFTLTLQAKSFATLGITLEATATLQQLATKTCEAFAMSANSSG
jgi:hypothetical protein